MYSKVTIAGHPVHAALVAFPIAFYAAALLGFVVYWLGGDVLWFRIGIVANVAGVVMALVAALPGFIDWAMGVPTGSAAKATGLKHMLVQVGALIVFVINLALQWPKWPTGAAVPDVGASVVLSLIGVALTAIGGALGWKLVAVHHVGVKLTPEQERLEPRVGTHEPRVADVYPPVSGIR